MVTVLLITLALLSVLLSISMLYGIISRLGKDFVPFVPLPHDTIVRIYNELHLKPQSILYDLGCGDGRILRYCHDQMPQATYKGYEIKWEALALAYLKNRRIFSRKFSIHKKDFFKQSLNDATHLALYLLPKTLDALLPKLEQELKPGTRVISADFCFTHRKPDAVIVLNKPRLRNGFRIFIYTF